MPHVETSQPQALGDVIEVIATNLIGISLIDVLVKPQDVATKDLFLCFVVAVVDHLGNVGVGGNVAVRANEEPRTMTTNAPNLLKSCDVVLWVFIIKLTIGADTDAHNARLR